MVWAPCLALLALTVNTAEAIRVALKERHYDCRQLWIISSARQSWER